MFFFIQIVLTVLCFVEKGLLKLFFSVMNYGDVIYRHASASTLKPLDAVYHSALWFITGNVYSIHHCTLNGKAGWSSLSERRDKHMYLFIYKALIGKLPSYILQLCIIILIHCFHCFQVPRVCTEFEDLLFVLCSDRLQLFAEHPRNGQLKSMITIHLSSVCTCFNLLVFISCIFIICIYIQIVFFYLIFKSFYTQHDCKMRVSLK